MAKTPQQLGARALGSSRIWLHSRQVPRLCRRTPPCFFFRRIFTSFLYKSSSTWLLINVIIDKPLVIVQCFRFQWNKIDSAVSYALQSWNFHNRLPIYVFLQYRLSFKKLCSTVCTVHCVSTSKAKRFLLKAGWILEEQGDFFKRRRDFFNGKEISVKKEISV